MYTMMFIYTDKTFQEYQHIVKAQYSTFDDYVVEGDKILTHDFPLNADILLFSENKSYKISSKNLKSIEITKETV